MGLDTTMTEDLRREGLLREIVRTVQDARKQADLEISDRIILSVSGSPNVTKVLDDNRQFVMNETLATQWGTPAEDGSFRVQRQLDDESWTIVLARAS